MTQSIPINTIEVIPIKGIEVATADVTDRDEAIVMVARKSAIEKISMRLQRSPSVSAADLVRRHSGALVMSAFSVGKH